MKKMALALIMLIIPSLCMADKLDEARVVKIELLLYPDMHRGGR